MQNWLQFINPKLFLFFYLLILFLFVVVHNINEKPTKRVNRNLLIIIKLVVSILAIVTVNLLAFSEGFSFHVIGIYIISAVISIIFLFFVDIPIKFINEVFFVERLEERKRFRENYEKEELDSMVEDVKKVTEGFKRDREIREEKFKIALIEKKKNRDQERVREIEIENREKRILEEKQLAKNEENKIIKQEANVIQTDKKDLSKRQIINPYVDSEDVEVKIIKSVPEVSFKEPKRIGFMPNYNLTQEEPYNYAVVKMPRKNSLIKFPRKGRSNKKGFKEDDFFVHLNTYFKAKFNVFNDRHIPTENGKPYEPDFVVSTERDNRNIFINIEIDEPYDGWMRTPTHCIGDNDLRDDFFTKRGWIVIRFAEIQVHLEPKKCCSFIASVIRSIDDTFHCELLDDVSCNEIEQWDNLQAKKWASQKYREKYLGINDFGKRANVITEYLITESDIDKIVEKEVPKSQNKFIKESGSLAIQNKNNRDKRIKFDPIEHRYFIDNNPDTISVTQLIDKFFPEFDSGYWAPIKATQRGISTAAILSEWEAKRNDSANKGTALHEAIENFYNDIEHNATTKEFKHFLSFKQRFNKMIPFRSEWRIFDEDMLVAGTIDMVYKKDDGSLYMFDWKRSEKVVRSDGTIKNDNYQYAFGELGHLGDNSFNKYCLQQNIYKAILEKRYNQKISSMNLLVLHDTFDNYHHIPIPNMDKEVNYIFSYAHLMR